MTEVWRFRETLFRLSMKELAIRYRNSFLGFLWSMLNPLLLMLVYTTVFSTIMQIGIPRYPLFLLVGLLPWTFFSTAVPSGMQSLLANAGLVKKVAFPRVLLPGASVIANFINMFLSYGAFIAIVLALRFKVPVGPQDLAMVPLMLSLFLWTCGLTFALAGLIVHFRDLEHLIGVLLAAWFYLTPIVYPLHLVPVKYRGALMINPLTLWFHSFVAILYWGRSPGSAVLWQTGAESVVVFAVGWLLFNRLSRDAAEVI